MRVELSRQEFLVTLAALRFFAGAIRGDHQYVHDYEDLTTDGGVLPEMTGKQVDDLATRIDNKDEPKPVDPLYQPLITVAFGPADILAIRDDLTLEQAIEFLNDNEDEVETRLIDKANLWFKNTLAEDFPLNPLERAAVEAVKESMRGE